MSLDHSHCGLAAHKTCAQKTTWEPKFKPGFTPNKNFQYLRKELQVVNFGSRLWHQDCTRINQLDKQKNITFVGHKTNFDFPLGGDTIIPQQSLASQNLQP